MKTSLRPVAESPQPATAEVLAFQQPRPGRRQLLGAVVCPLTAAELDAALANMALWDSSMFPLRKPVGSAGGKTRLIFSFNCAPDPALSGPLLAAYARSGNVRRAFAGIEVRFCDLPPDKDRYEREPGAEGGPYGAKAGPNWLFYETLKAMRGEARFIFLMETDCRPLKSDWLRTLQRACRKHDDAWIVGAPYLGASNLKAVLARHINGNALYQVGDDDFWALLDEVLWPWMHRRIAAGQTDLAYDCAWEAFLNREEMADSAHPDWRWSRMVMTRMRMAGFIVNIAGRIEQSGQYLWSRRQVSELAPEAVLVHGPLAPDDRHRRGFANLGPARLEGIVREAEVFAVAPDGEGVWTRTFWLAGQDLRAGDVLELNAVVRSDFAFRLNISFTDVRGRYFASTKVKHAGIDDPGADGPTSTVRFALTCERPSPYVQMTMSFMHLAPEAMRIGVEDCTLSVRRGDERLGQIRRLLD